MKNSLSFRKLHKLNFKNHIAIIFVFAVTLLNLNINNDLHSSELRLVRTDVDSTRDTVITASYNFSVDFYIDDIENCNSAAFQIRYTNANNVKLSSYKIGDFGEEGKLLIVPPKDGTSSDESIIRMAVTSARPIGENEFDNPKILTLEFTVLQSASHKQKMQIEFLDATATAYIDSIPTEVKLDSKSVEYTIHSFVNVFPGDADNNGVVDIKDWTKIDLFTSIDPVSDKSRRFKRRNASTMWSSQLVLAWDNEFGTFADCDGDGSITVSDAIVVVQNDAKTHSIFNNGDSQSGLISNNNDISETENINNSKVISNKMLSENTIKFPINISTEKNYKAIELHLDFNKIKSKVNNSNYGKYDEFVEELTKIQFNKEGEFAKYNSEYILDSRNAKDGKISLVIASFDGNYTSKNYDRIGNISFNGIDNLDNEFVNLIRNLELYEITDKIFGIDNFGNKFEITPISDYTSVENDNKKSIKIIQYDNILSINSNENTEIKSLELYNTNGEIIKLGYNNLAQNLFLANSNILLDLGIYNLSQGMYIIRIEYFNNNKLENISQKVIINN